jgi:hypothetical protein
MVVLVSAVHDSTAAQTPIAARAQRPGILWLLLLWIAFINDPSTLRPGSGGAAACFTSRVSTDMMAVGAPEGG